MAFWWCTWGCPAIQWSGGSGLIPRWIFGGKVASALSLVPAYNVTGGIPLSSFVGFELLIFGFLSQYPGNLDGAAWTWLAVLHSGAFFCHNGPLLPFDPIYTLILQYFIFYIAVLINPLWVSVPIFVAFYPWGGVFRPSGCEHT